MSARGSRNGSVLIIVLLVLSAATFLMLEAGRLLRMDYEGAAYQRVLASGGALVTSGLFAAQELLVEDVAEGELADHPFEDWANADTFFTEISSGLESGDLSVDITAEDGKINLNHLSLRSSDPAEEGEGEDGASTGNGLGEMFVRLTDRLRRAHGIEGDAEKFLESVRTWRGAKDIQRDGDWYALEEPPYVMPKGQFLSPHELMLVRWDGLNEEDRRRIIYGEGEIPGLIEFVTVWGPGFINMNFAPPEVVAAACSDEALRDEYVAEVLDYRALAENDFGGTWYKDIATRVGLSMGTFPDTILSVTSTTFRATVEARVGAGRLRSTAILRRSGNRCVVLFENIH